MQVKFATIDSDPLKLDKRGDFTSASPISLNCQVSAPINTETPVFLVENAGGGSWAYNYAYVEKWGKYYFLGEPTYIDGNRLTISGMCDVLTTNADGIKQLNINAVRTSSKGNKKLYDRLRPTQTNRQCETIEFKNCGLGANYETDIVYVLTVQGGAHRAISV